MTTQDTKRDDLLSALSSLLGLKNAEDCSRYIHDGRLSADVPPINSESCELAPADIEFFSGAIVRVGGGGVVVQCQRKGFPQLQYALKIPRPSVIAVDSQIIQESKSQAEKEFEKAQQEFRSHLPLAHQHVAKLHVVGKVSIKYLGRQFRLPYTLIEWVRNALPFEEFLFRQECTAKDLVELLIQWMEALQHLHENGLIHWDIKSDNLLVGSGRILKLTDLGNARPLRGTGESYKEPQEFNSTLRNLPPALQTKALAAKRNSTAGTQSTNRVECGILPTDGMWDRPFLDLYMTGREINRLLGVCKNSLKLDEEIDKRRSRKYEALRKSLKARLFPEGDSEASFIYDFLEVVIKRLLVADGAERKPYYDAAADVAKELRRLAPEFGEGEGVPELRAIPQRVLRLPPHLNVPWTQRVDKLANSLPFRRLNDHRQLATVYHAFPGARHSRWSHVLGTFAAVADYLRALFADRSNPFFRIQTSEMDVRALLLAALFHDLGHIALGHYLEELPALATTWRHEVFALHVLNYCIDPQAELKLTPKYKHQVEADAHILKPVILKYWANDNQTECESLLKRVIAILQEKSADITAMSGRPIANAYTDRDAADAAHLHILHSIISGPIDADKFDYLRRDGHHAAVDYPHGIDTGRFLQSLTVAPLPPPNHKPTICVQEKGILPVESLIIARYQMFRAMYWQHTVRSHTVMLQYIVEYYLHPPGTKSINAKKVDDLISKFRELSDDNALRWLYTQLLPTGNSGRRSKQHSAPIDMCEALLGDRSKIYWKLEEVFAHSNMNVGTPDSASKPHQDDAIYWKLVSAWDGWQKLPPEECINRKREFLSQLTRELRAALGKRKALLKKCSLGDVLIDVPLRGKDQVLNLLVLRGGLRNSTVCPFDEVTPLGAAVSEAFGRSARLVRVFIRPTIAQDLSRELSPNQMRELTRLALEASVDRIKPELSQMNLF